MDGRVGKHPIERVRYVINYLLHLVIVKYGVISLVLCISTRLRLVTILTLLMKYIVIFHTDPCNKSYIYHGYYGNVNANHKIASIYLVTHSLDNFLISLIKQTGVDTEFLSRKQ